VLTLVPLPLSVCLSLSRSSSSTCPNVTPCIPTSTPFTLSSHPPPIPHTHREHALTSKVERREGGAEAQCLCLAPASPLPGDSLSPHCLPTPSTHSPLPVSVSPSPIPTPTPFTPSPLLPPHHPFLPPPSHLTRSNSRLSDVKAVQRGSDATSAYQRRYQRLPVTPLPAPTSDATSTRPWPSWMQFPRDSVKQGMETRRLLSPPPG